MKYFSILLTGLLLFSSCASDDNGSVEESTEPLEIEQSQTELKKSSETLMAQVIDASELDLQMDGGKMWVINEESYTQLMKIKQQIYVISGNMENYTVESYNEMGNEFLGFIGTIPPAEDEMANVEFQKIISATKDQCLFLVESNLQHAQIAVINMSIIYEEVPMYFTPLKN